MERSNITKNNVFKSDLQKFISQTFFYCNFIKIFRSKFVFFFLLEHSSNITLYFFFDYPTIFQVVKKKIHQV